MYCNDLSREITLNLNIKIIWFYLTIFNNNYYYDACDLQSY